LSAMADMAYREGWFSLEYLTHDELPFFLNEKDRVGAEEVRRISLFVTGLDLLLSDPDAAGLDHYIEESIIGNDAPEELLAAEFLRCVATRQNGDAAQSRLLKLI